jgi:type III secretion protein D
MERAPTPVTSLDALELRVLDGAQRGARAPLRAGTPCVIAADPGTPGVPADIVLREDRSAPAAVRVTPDLTHALVEVLHGEVRLGDQVLSAGAHAPWSRTLPLQLGSARIAFGLACEDQWALGESGEHGPASEAHAAPAAPRTPMHRRPELWLAGLGAGVLLLCAAAFGVMQHAAEAKPVLPASDSATVVQQLQASEFAALQVRRLPDDRIEVTGRLGTLAQRARLDDWITAHHARASIDVAVDEAIQREVTEVFRVNGVAAQVHAAGGGRFVAEAAEPVAARLARAEEVVRRDVGGLVALTVRNIATPPPPPAPVLPDDPGKRIASIVPGETAYVVTADGSRYFLGATLPSGHRITAVAAHQLTLERDGRQSTLNF